MRKKLELSIKKCYNCPDMDCNYVCIYAINSIKWKIVNNNRQGVVREDNSVKNVTLFKKSFKKNRYTTVLTIYNVNKESLVGLVALETLECPKLRFKVREKENTNKTFIIRTSNCNHCKRNLDKPRMSGTCRIADKLPCLLLREMIITELNTNGIPCREVLSTRNKYYVSIRVEDTSRDDLVEIINKVKTRNSIVVGKIGVLIKEVRDENL